MNHLEAVLELFKTNTIEYSLRIATAIAIFYIGKYIAKFLSRVADRALQRANADATLAGFLKNVVYALLFAVVIIATLNALGIQTTSLVAVMGAAGLAVGLSLKDQVSNFGAGVLIIMIRPFKVGDLVTIAGQNGTIETIQIFQTIMKTADNLTIMVPNSKVMAGEIINYSLKGTRLISLRLTVSYKNDIKKAKDVLIEIMNSHSLVLKEPAATAGVQDLVDGGITLFANAWVITSNWASVRADLLENIKNRFEQEGITLPVPAYDINLTKPEAKN